MSKPHAPFGRSTSARPPIADTAYGAAQNLAWLVKQRKITPHIPAEMMAERGVSLAHTTIACRPGVSWRVDETHLKIKCSTSTDSPV